MGGIVAADTLIALTSDKAIDSTDSKADETFNSFMFPYVAGVLAFDTPYLGISPGVVAHGAEEHYNTASTALTQLSGLGGMIWGGSKAAEENAKATSKDGKKPAAALSSPPAIDANTPAWQKWGKMAIYAGAAGAVAAGGAAAYMKRDQITSGWSWVGSHLEFVGCLMRGEELRKRVSTVSKLNKELDVGFANLYTRLGNKAQNKDGSMVGSVIGHQRTFCNLPTNEIKGYFREAINDAAADEAAAHMSKFPWSLLLDDANRNSYVFPEGQPRILCSV